MGIRSWFLVSAFALLMGCTFGFGLDLISALLPDVKRDFNLSDADLGDLAGFGRVGFVLGAIASAFIVTILASSTTVFLACTGCGLGLYFLSASTSAYGIAGSIFVTSLFTAMSWVPMTGVFASFVPRWHRAKAFGTIIAGAGIGTSLVGLLVPYFLANHSWRIALTSASLATFFVVLFAVFTWKTIRKETSTPSQDEPIGKSKFGDLKAVFDLRLIGIFIMFFLVGMTVHPFQIFLSTYIRDGLHFDADVAGNAWLTIGLVGLWAGIFMGYLGDRFSIRFTMVLSAGLLCTACLVLILLQGPLWILASVFIFSLSYYAMPGLLPAFISIAYPEKVSVQLFSIGSTTLGLGTVVGNVTGGRLSDNFGTLSAYYIFCACAAIVLALCALTFMKTKKSASN